MTAISKHNAVLTEVTLTPQVHPLPKSVSVFVEDALQRSQGIDCFDFVPSNYESVYAALHTIPSARFCEWGSGIGIVTGMAEMLGFEACGIEIDARLAAASRGLLRDFKLSAPIETGDYFESTHSADVYFTYCWPGKISRVEQYFLSIAPDRANLLICYGADDVRCRQKENE